MIVQLTEGTTIKMRYELKKELVQHPLFRVFSAKDRVASKDVCVRILKSNYHNSAVTEAINNAIYHSHACHHPCLEKLIECSVVDGDIIIISDLYRGEVLSETIPELAPFSQQLSLELILFIAEGLDELHHKGKFHGCLSPDSVVVASDGNVKILHAYFWNVYNANSSTLAAILYPLLPYLSPEYYSGTGHNHKSDIYALGVMFYELLTGRTPFVADSYEGYKEKHISAPIPKISKYLSDIPDYYEYIVRKCLSKNPEDRYDNIRLLIADCRCIRDARKFGKPVHLPSLSHTHVPKVRDDSNYQDTRVKIKDEEARKQSQYMQLYTNKESSRDSLIKITREEKIPCQDTNQVAPKMSVACEEEQKLSKRRKQSGSSSIPKWLLGIVYVCVFALLSIGGGWVYFNMNQPKLHIMPNIVGMNIQETRDKLNALKLTLRINNRETNEKYGEGVILDVNPVPGYSVREGSTIYVTVSSGSKFAQVPNFKGLSIDEARSMAANLSLNIEEMPNRTTSTAIPINMIARQEPESGLKAEKGKNIKVWLSSGAPRQVREGGIQKNPYTLKINVPNSQEPVLLRIDMIDEIETKTVYEKLHKKAEKIEKQVEGFGNQVMFRIYFDGVHQRTIVKNATEPSSAPATAPPAINSGVNSSNATANEVNQQQQTPSATATTGNAQTSSAASSTQKQGSVSQVRPSNQSNQPNQSSQSSQDSGKNIPAKKNSEEPKVNLETEV